MNYNIITYTLVFVKNNKNLLLGFKKRGLGKHKWNGFGGKLEKNETLHEGALRELQEESSLSATKLNHVGILLYEVTHRARVDLVHVFTTNEYTGIPSESDEMIPQWYNVKDIPYENMWPDAKLWHPFMLKDKYFVAHVIYKDEEEITKADVKEYNSIKPASEAVKNLTSQLELRVIDV